VDAAWEYASPVVVTATAAALVALERRFPATPGQRLLREGFWVDLVGYALLQSWALALVIAWITAALDRATGLSRLHLVSSWPAAAQLLFFLVEHDLYIYLFHRWQHRNPWLWRLHEAHHSVREVDWLAGARSHALEILVNQTIEFAPMALLGAAPEVVLAKGLLDAIWGMWIHSNVGVRTGWLQRIVNGPEMHRWHHATEIVDVNFATKLADWDWLFGTAYPDLCRPAGFGLAGDRPPAPSRAGASQAGRPGADAAWSWISE
jgi:sterol desaturase/sphingolipid hydroxylase (fatty acid hydroxylase superfamily)